VGYSAKGLTPKLGLGYRFAPRWNVGGGAFFTAFTFGDEPADFTLRFLGVNLRINYQLSSIRDPWSLGLGLGVYYTTTLASDARMGFNNVMGPQFGGSLRYRFNARDALVSTFKFAPMGESFFLRNISDRELALGLGVSRAFSNGKSGSLMLDWANFRMVLSGFQVDNTTLSLTAGYAF
jgi:hypothetical protein